MSPKLQNETLHRAKSVVSTEIVSDDPTKITQIIHEREEFIDIDEKSLYNKIKICVGRLIQTPAEIMVHGASMNLTTGIFIRESDKKLFGFVLSKSDDIAYSLLKDYSSNKTTY